MEVLNAAVLTPISLHKPTYSSERRAEPNKFFHSKLSRNFSASLAAFSSVLCNNGFAKALTYEEALSQSGSSSDFDVGNFVDGIVRFGSENPLIIGGGAAVVIVPLILSQILKNPKGYGVETAKIAYAKLSEDPDAQLLDIREGKDFREVGGPDVRSLKKKAVSVAFIRDDKPGFLKKLSLKFKDPGSTTLFILDKFDGNSELVAELVTANGFKAAYAIKDGAEGARGWMKSGLPWISPKKTLDFGDLKDSIANIFSEGPDGLPATLGLAAATGLGLFTFTEADTLLQLLGSAAIVQFVTKKLLFAEDRKVTLQQIDEFLATKIAPKELVGELKMIGKALLPAATSTEASLPAPAEAKPDTSTSATPLKVDAVTETKPDLNEEATAEPPPVVNSVPKAAVSEGSLSGLSRPLSPYPNYPDFKPPSSPSPSKP